MLQKRQLSPIKGLCDMKSLFSNAVLAGTSLLAIAACTSVKPNLEIAAAQDRLAASYANKDIVDRGQADLGKANTAILAAQEHWGRGHKENAAHHIFMAQTSLDIADVRGQQAKMEQETVSIRNKAMLADQQSKLAGKQSQLTTTQAELADRDQQLVDARNKLQAYDMKMTELGSTLVLQDLSFETGKANLRSGAANRLQPMITYLGLSPQTRVRIEGHTDNRGGMTYNQQLSFNRADAVKMAFISGGVDIGRIDIVGSGFSKPVGSNDTISGRESNRRVEITLLK
jgi:outer membrane protein OmpA-like peptidoglycan-associated protein